MQLCRNRPEGFGPHSQLHPSVPTTCAIDVWIEPLPTWLLILFGLPLVYILYRPERRHNFGHAAQRRSDKRSWRTCTFLLKLLYAFFIIAMIALVCLEIARLARASLGVGLLPFTLVGLVLAACHTLFWPSRRTHLVNLIFWLMLTVVLAIKIAAVQYEQEDARVRRPFGTEYPTSDQALDNAVMVGLTSLLAIMEIFAIRHERKQVQSPGAWAVANGSRAMPAANGSRAMPTAQPASSMAYTAA